jgi:hypothetical protein
MKKTLIILVLLSLATLMFARAVPYDESYVVYHDEGFDYSGMRAEAAGMMTRDGADLTEIYVSPTGSDDTGTGTELAPFATLQHAVDNAADGTSGSPTMIWLEDGQYTGMLTMSGREYITFDGVDSGAIYIPDSYVTNEEPYGLEAANEERCILTMNCENIHFEDIEFDFSDVPQTYAKINAISLTESSVSFNDCYFHDLSRTDNHSEILISPKTTFGATNISAEGYTPAARALIEITNSEFKDPGRICVNGGGYILVSFDNCEAYRTYTDFGYVLDCSRLASTEVKNSTIYGFDMDLGASGVSGGLLLGAYFTVAVTEEVMSSHLVENCEMYFNFIGCIMGSDSYWGGTVDPGNVILEMDFINNFSHDNYDNGFTLDAGRNDLGFETILRTENNTYINNGTSDWDAGFYAWTRGDGDITLTARGENIDHNPTGLLLAESDTAWDAEHPTVWNIDIKFCNLDFCTNVGAYSTFQLAQTIDLSYNYWGNADMETYLYEDTNATINYKPMLAGEVKRYAKVNSTTPTEFGPANADMSVTASIANETNFVDLYQCNNLSAPLETTIAGMADYHRLGMMYGAKETGNATATLVFDITDIDQFEAYSNDPVLLKRVAIDTLWGDWVNTGATLVGNSFTLTDVTEFGEYVIGCYSIAPEINEDETVVDPDNSELTFGWEDTGATSYNVYSSSDPYAASIDWVYVTNISTQSYSGSADNMYYRVVPIVGGRELINDPSAVVGGVTYTCEANDNGTNINVIALPLMPNAVTMASDLGDYIGTDIVNTISKWDIYSQSWQSASYMTGFGWGGDFELEAGEAYMVGVLEDCNIVIAGAIPVPREGYLVTGGTTNANFVMLPLNRFGVDTFVELSTDIDAGTHIVNSISYWNNLTQNWTSKSWSTELEQWVGNDYDLDIGMPYMFFPTEYVAWPTHE